MAFDLNALPDRTLDFLRDRHFASLTTTRPDGTLHAALVGFTFDVDTRTAFLIIRGRGVKLHNLTAAPGQAVVLCQSAGGRWVSLEGRAEVVDGDVALADTLRRYRDRYGEEVGDDPTRRCLRVHVSRITGTG